MHTLRLVSAALVWLAGSAWTGSQPVLGAAVSFPFDTASPVAARWGDFADFSNAYEDSGLPGNSALDSLHGILLASADSELSPMLTLMLALYSQLLALEGQAADGIRWQRLQARLANVGVADKTAMLDIHDVLAADFDRVELLALEQKRFAELGLDASALARLPVRAALVEQVKSAMMELPQSLNRFNGPVAVAVWGERDGKPALVSLLVRAD